MIIFQRNGRPFDRRRAFRPLGGVCRQLQQLRLQHARLSLELHNLFLRRRLSSKLDFFPIRIMLSLYSLNNVKIRVHAHILTYIYTCYDTRTRRVF